MTQNNTSEKERDKTDPINSSLDVTSVMLDLPKVMDFLEDSSPAVELDSAELDLAELELDSPDPDVDLVASEAPRNGE